MRVVCCFMLLSIWIVAAPAGALTVPFTEEFAADAAAWRNGAADAELGWVAAGGPDASSYASGPLDFEPFAADDTFVVARAQDEYGSSGGAFEGDWLAEDVLSLSVWIRHDAPVPLSPFARITPPGNFPGAIAIHFGAPVLPNVWTQVSFDVTPGSPQLVFEGGSHAAIFGGVGHVQLGVTAPAALADAPGVHAFDVDGVSIVPEPTPAALLGLALLGAAVAGRRRD